MTVWIMMCLALVLIWIVTILLVRALIGGRPGKGGADARSKGVGVTAYEPEVLGDLDNTLTSSRRDSHRRHG